MSAESKLKGDIGATQVIADLTMKGYTIFVPIVCESLHFDLIAFKDNKLSKIQCKYSTEHHLCSKTSWSDKKGSHERIYQDSDFDYYGLYLPDIEKVVYPSIKFKGNSIRTTLPNSATPFYWWEDFVNFTDTAQKKTYQDFGYTLTCDNRKGTENLLTRKIIRPTKEELFVLLWEKPTSLLAQEFGVSDTAIAKWAKSYGIEKPPRGYWNKIPTKLIKEI